jgi:hypothetical protein
VFEIQLAVLPMELYMLSTGVNVVVGNPVGLLVF